MKITVIGTGYVGLVTGACFAEMGNQVLCVDHDPQRIAALQAGAMPIYEPGLPELVQRNAAAGRLAFTTDSAEGTAHGLIQIIAVGTPPGPDGGADLSQVLAAATTIATHMTDYRLVVNKSTVPVGTADQVRSAMDATLRARGLAIEYAVVSNPEFLKEGSAIDDCMRPNRVVVGADNPRALELMHGLYAPFMRNRERLLAMDVRSAEFTKYAANAMLATRISFMNELALLAQDLGADIEQVRLGIGTDPRIGTHFLYAGVGYGGACFPKDVQALLHTGAGAGHTLGILQAVQAANLRQRQTLVDRVLTRFGPQLHGHRFALWGLAFKPGTDDVREAPSLHVIRALLAQGAQVCAYDPVATESAQRALGPLEGLDYASTAQAALQDADALIIVTEWKEFRSPDFAGMARALRQPVVFDGRNLFDPGDMRAHGLQYHAMGRGAR